MKGSFILLDLHVHTRYSADGQGTPEDYISRASEIGLSGISFTEHQNVSSSREGIRLAERFGLCYVVGAEFCVPYVRDDFLTDLHILVYGFDLDDIYVRKYLSAVREQEKKYIDALLAGLRKLGVDITRERVLKAVEEYGWSRKEVDSIYIRRLMRQLGYAKDKSESSRLERQSVSAAGFEGLSQYPDREILFESMNRAGAVCVLAHPCYYTDSKEMIEDIVSELIDVGGICGIEVFHPSNPVSTRDWLVDVAERYSLFITGGSDAHRVEQLGAERVEEDVLKFIRCVNK